MTDEKKQEIIESYIAAYNAFDVETMLKDISEDVLFKNIENGVVTIQTQGVKDFKKIAQETSKFFKSREQRILNYDFTDDCAIVYVNFEAVVALDITEKLKKGDSFELDGKSIFTFSDNKITVIEDYS